ncbi:hypothetical protein H8N03_05570 [Ramlibacter sp. USB13]|uniref:Uncharacterized protein n=1 Tax=Ramlibacter cellulosilyticus TaxID=2764187 RepID=A0A923MMK4_9BURK|nr:hypothetical protein [Ramlibacter cellulosilyticus]MBC5782402.1 hypothetical protein [Ramlibacter cellulosilyticus]
MTQRATLGAEHAASQCRPPTFTLHDVVPEALPTLVLVLVLVTVETLPSRSTPVTLLVVLLLMLVLLEVASAPAPLAARHSTRAAEEKRGRSPFPPAARQVRACPCSAAMAA